MAKLLTTVLDKSLQWALMHSAEAECFAGAAWPLTVTFYLNEITQCVSQVLPWGGFCLVSVWSFPFFSAAFNFRSSSTFLDYGVLLGSVLEALLLLYLLRL